jgi:hypothetical protein
MNMFKPLIAGIAMTLSTAPVDAGPNAPAPSLAYAFSVRATLAPPVEQGEIDGKRARFIAVTGGTVVGIGKPSRQMG